MHKLERLLDRAAHVSQSSVMTADRRLAEFAAFAEELAAVARAETLPRWLAGCAVEDKGNGAFDPVTEADRAAERAMRALIRHRYPEHGASGEEMADEPAAGPYCWSLDPIDGTRAFICRLPTWTTLIALLENGRPVLGLIDAPFLDQRFLGFADQCSLTAKGERTSLATSGCARLEEARLSTTDPFLFSDAEAHGFNAVRQAARTTRYGLDGYGYACVARGSIDLVIESGLKPHDYNALVPVVTAAGGTIGDWRGGTAFETGQVVAAASRQLYDEAVELLARAA